MILDLHTHSIQSDDGRAKVENYCQWIRKKEIPLDGFWDLRGEGPFPGGLLRYYPPTPVRLVQLQPAPDAPLVGLVAIPTERELDTIRIRGDS